MLTNTTTRAITYATIKKNVILAQHHTNSIRRIHNFHSLLALSQKKPNNNENPHSIIRFHQTNTNSNPRDIHIKFRTSDDELITVEAAKGENILQIAHRNSDHGVEIEGACEGVCACSTCHIILEDNIYDILSDIDEDGISEDEEDMLDMAFGLTTTSRLGCQVQVTEDMEGAVIQIPNATRNFYVDGHIPKPH